MGTSMLVGMDFSLRVRVVESTRAKNIQPAKADVLGSVYVGTLGMPAGFAKEQVPCFPVGFLRVPALVAALAGVPGINP